MFEGNSPIIYGNPRVQVYRSSKYATRENALVLNQHLGVLPDETETKPLLLIAQQPDRSLEEFMRLSPEGDLSILINWSRSVDKLSKIRLGARETARTQLVRTLRMIDAIRHKRNLDALYFPTLAELRSVSKTELVDIGFVPKVAKYITVAVAPQAHS